MPGVCIIRINTLPLSALFLQRLGCSVARAMTLGRSVIFYSLAREAVNAAASATSPGIVIHGKNFPEAGKLGLPEARDKKIKSTVRHLGIEVDEVLHRSVEPREMPGVVAMAADDRGVIYEGGFGVRRLGGVQPMTLDRLFHPRQ
jgi:hypothetical protein